MLPEGQRPPAHLLGACLSTAPRTCVDGGRARTRSCCAALCTAVPRAPGARPRLAWEASGQATHGVDSLGSYGQLMPGGKEACAICATVDALPRMPQAYLPHAPKLKNLKAPRRSKGAHAGGRNLRGPGGSRWGEGARTYARTDGTCAQGLPSRACGHSRLGGTLALGQACVPSSASASASVPRPRASFFFFALFRRTITDCRTHGAVQTTWPRVCVTHVGRRGEETAERVAGFQGPTKEQKRSSHSRKV